MNHNPEDPSPSKLVVQTGLELFVQNPLASIEGASVGLLVHPASIDTSFRHAIELVSKIECLRLVSIFGPQHGLFGETQDNMIEWRSYRNKEHDIPVHSLYGSVRAPTPEMLENLDVLLIDLQDVGTRVYTFLWSVVLCMRASAQSGKKIVLLDRPNPLNGLDVEGPLLQSEYASFVGLYPLPMRHGLTLGEAALYLNERHSIGCDLQVVPMQGWNREQFFDQTDLPWVLPSPNMPTMNTAMVYPGAVLLEGTNASEGRGTARPFELVGFPGVNASALAGTLEKAELPGVQFRPHSFQPTFQKHSGKLCGGVQIHVTDRRAFRPVLTGVTLITALRQLAGDSFEWSSPPYEYVTDRLPIDVIWGSDSLRKDLDRGKSPLEMAADWSSDEEAFRAEVEPFLLY